MRDELDPLNTFKNLLNNWWKIVLAAVLVGLVGLVISFILPPTYQAEATFHASIDFTQINFENLVDDNNNPVRFTQYDEDLALQVVQRVLLAEMDEAFDYALTLDPALDIETFKHDMQIQRYHAKWHLRYRHEDPKIAQAIVNYWAENGMEGLREAQATGEAESFVIVDLVSEALLPQTPLYRNRNTLVVAGTVVGFVAGIILVDSQTRFGLRRDQEV